MERPERTPAAGIVAGPSAAAAASFAAAHSVAFRGFPDNPTQGRRLLLSSAAMANGPSPPPPMPLPPIPNVRNGLPNGCLSTSNSITPAQVINIAREAVRSALENESQTADVGPGLKSGATIDLCRRGLQKLPEEVVDIVKNELERLALSHNHLSYLPARFGECASLRYLNIRGNQLKEFPMPICELKALEILDLGRNQLRVLPPEIIRLSSLKVLSVPKNQIRELPLCLADMVSLQVLKFEGNPISFPPRDAFQIRPSSPPNEGYLRENDVTEVTVTARIKKFLRQYVINGRESKATGYDSSEGTDTPRFPLKRAASGRFPIKVNGSEMSDKRSSNLGARPPPIPSRSHYRGLSQQNTATRRPGVLPLTIGSGSERLRSNLETLLRSGRSESRQRRMGMLPKQKSDLGTLDETEASNRWSHYRGLSHGSAMQGAPDAANSPRTPTESPLQRPIYVRRLSVLPERRRESKIFDPVIEAAKGILYSVFQIHPMIQMLMTLMNDGSAKRSSLEIVFYNTNSHVQELEQEIQKHEMALTKGSEPSCRDNANVHRACQTLVGAYGHVCTLLADNIDTFVNNGDARYIRTLLVLLYNSIMELRVTLASVSAEHLKRPTDPAEPNSNDTIKPYLRGASAVTPTAKKTVRSRSRTGTILHNPSNLRVATDVVVPYANGRGRNTRLASTVPRSNKSLPPVSSRNINPDLSDEDAQFDRIHLALQRSTDAVLHIIPNFNVQLTGGIRNAMQQRAPGGLIRGWRSLIAMCNETIQQTEILKNRLPLVKMKDPIVRSHPSFWNQCNNFVVSWSRMASKIKAEFNNIPLPPDTKSRLKPIHQNMKETSNAILQSPWHHLFRPSGASASSSGSFGKRAQSPTQLPITPQSAALGPAMQATVATPQAGSFVAVFQGNVFDRADTLMANPGIFMSRAGTMIRGHSGFNSLSSMSSMSSDGVATPSSTLSPIAQLGPASFRLNGGKMGP